MSKYTWTKRTPDDWNGEHQYVRTANGCEVVHCVQPGETPGEGRRFHISHTSPGGVSALPTVPEGVDTDDFCDAYAQLLDEFQGEVKIAAGERAQAKGRRDAEAEQACIRG